MAKRRTRRKKRTSSRASLPQSEMPASVDLSTEYRYVADDLSRIGIIAAILIAALVALSFFL